MNKKSVLGELAELARMSTAQLREKWKVLVGPNPPAYSKKGLFRKLAVVVQRLHYGDLSKSVAERLDGVLAERGVDPLDSRTFAKGKRPRGTNKRHLPVGSRYRTEWRGKAYTMTILTKGVEVNGRQFNSPAHAVREITGSHRNGYRFFGIP